MDQKAQAQCYTTQLIEGDGTFNAARLDHFIKQVKLKECGPSYAIVAIMGPQSSGKSTLLNHVFHTNFKEMNAKEGRKQTTKGIWIARPVGIEPCTIVMDVEGSDGKERGQDDTAFEKQSALFAMAISHIVIINLWCNDIGREHAANRPLLRTVFEVMLLLFSPHKTTLMFVIRDKTETPFEILERDLKTDLQEIWDSVPKRGVHTQLSEFFNIEVVALSSYIYQKVEFKAEVASLRKKFFHSIAHGDRRDVVPATGFTFGAQNIWKDIMENKQLDLPAHRILVANKLCGDIAEKMYSSFVENKERLKLEEDVKSHLVPGFEKKLDSLYHSCLSKYYKEVLYFDEDVGFEKAEQLEEKLMQHVRQAHNWTFKHIRSEAVDAFKKDALEKAVNNGLQFTCDGLKYISIKLVNEICEKNAIGKQFSVDLTETTDELSRDLIEAQKRMIAEKSRQDAERGRSELEKKYMIAEKSRQDGERRIEELKKQNMKAEEMYRQAAEIRGKELEKQRMIAEETRQAAERRVKELEKQILVANKLCGDIAEKMYSSFVENKDWLKLEEDVKSRLVPGFEEKLSSLYRNCLSKYDEEALNFDVNVGNEKKEQLKEKLMQMRSVSNLEWTSLKQRINFPAILLKPKSV